MPLASTSYKDLSSWFVDRCGLLVNGDLTRLEGVVLLPSSVVVIVHHGVGRGIG